MRILSRTCRWRRPELKDALRAAWPTSEELADWPRERVANLVEERYGLEAWNLAYGRS